MAWVEEIALSSSWNTDEDQSGGNIVLFLNQFNQVIAMTVDALGILTTVISTSNITPDRFLIESTDNLLYRLDTNNEVVLQTIITNDIYNHLDQRIVAPTGEAFDISILPNGILQTTLVP